MHALKKNRPLRRIVLASAATVCGTVLLLSLKPHSTPAVAVAVPAPSGSASAGASTGTRTVTGDTVQTRWGPVQVRITLKSGKLTEVTAVAYPTDNPRDQEINSFALPRLRGEALQAQSATIDTVSGATYTSDGYRQSLQSALDSASS
ncbi:FMN-binding protein [Streptomyces sp. NBC_00201]|uniref:FMN-binding protein n=1 Tax=unclassified Streptomyces TaxID=2593676 RepID=UPI0022508B33|nr:MULTISPECIES: FMN-binding protein [unclassified Streptomyces]MCX5058423.1 FMN-binding protein [Streptomyces sp. NBC_00452]MCX5244697.1 FMN-binding protein [Streptomyces sp. NBC_00201]MCX5289571.1 FMN-binding protein [Streptomyces sp. NBC_00183]